MSQTDPYTLGFGIVILIILCGVLLISIEGAIFVVVNFSLTLVSGRSCWSIMGLGANWALIVVIIILISCAIVYVTVALWKKVYLFLIQAGSYFFPAFAILFTIWDDLFASPRSSEVFFAVFKVAILEILGVILIIPVLGAVVAVIMFVVALIEGISFGGNIFFLVGLVVAFIVSMLLYALAIVILRFKWWSLIQGSCLMSPTFLLII